MGRPGLTKHRKFVRLGRLLGSELIARGALETLWDACYENGDAFLGDALDVEGLAHWDGEQGKLTDALINSGFIEPSSDNHEFFQVHDFWHHAPDYVRKRSKREVERRLRCGHQPSINQSVTSQCTGDGFQTRTGKTEMVCTPSPSPLKEHPLPPHEGVGSGGLTEGREITKRVAKRSPKEKAPGPSVNDLLGGKDTPASVTFWKAVAAWAKNRTQRLKDAAALWQRHIDSGLSPDILLVAVQRCMANFTADEISTGKVIRFDTWLEQEGFRPWLPEEAPEPGEVHPTIERNALYRKYIESNSMLTMSFERFKALEAGGVAP